MKILYFVLAFLLVENIAWAETITFKSGNEIEGTIIERTDYAIKVDMGHNLSMTYYFDEILSIKENDGSITEIGIPAEKAPVSAGQQSLRELAEELLLIMNVDKQQTEMFEQMKNMQMEQMQRMEYPGGDIPATLSERQNKFFDFIAGEMSWERMKDRYIDAYVEVFTEEEIQGMIEFFKGPIGQNFIQKTPELTTKLMRIGQQHMVEVLPKMEQMMREGYEQPTPKTETDINNASGSNGLSPD